MFTPPIQLDTGQTPPPALNNPEWQKHVLDRPDGGYNWAHRGFGPGNGMMPPLPPQPFQPIPQPFTPNLTRQPIMMPQSPVPQTPHTLAQMRSMMTQFHAQQMVARMQKHLVGHLGQE